MKLSLDRSAEGLVLDRVPAPAPAARRDRRRPARSVPAPALKVAWLTPLGPRSDIGTFSRAILKAAAEERPGLLDLVPAVNENGPTYFHAGPALQLDGARDEAVLQSFDAVVYNIGNNVENHGHINRLALRQPGVVVVHDLVMQHYIAWEAFERLRDTAVYADLIATHYGPRGLEALAASRVCARGGRPRYAPWDSAHVVDMPLIKPFIRSAAAVVVHSEFAEAQVRRFCQAPILRLGLPHDQKPALSGAEVEAWAAATRRRRGRVAFAAFGHIGRGKCLAQLIEAFRERPELAREASLVVAGYPTDRAHAQELVELARALDLADVVRFEFAVSPDRLQQLNRDADVFVNLRWPNTESASGSLVEQLNAGKPVMVYATGCYAEVPEELARTLDELAGYYDIVMLPLSHDYKDMDVSLIGQVHGLMRRPEAAIPLTEPLPPLDVARVVADCQLCLSMKFHGLVFAALSGVPFVNIGLTRKTAMLCADLGQPGLAVEPYTLTKARVLAAVKLAEAPETRDSLVSAVAGQVARAREAAEAFRGRVRECL